MDDEDEEENEQKKEAPMEHVNDVEKLPKKNGMVKKLSQNGIAGNGNSVISKESLILVPDNTITTNMNGQSNGKESPILQNNNDEVIYYNVMNNTL